jgi:O-antigen/teichoic acid export membrane protein
LFAIITNLSYAVQNLDLGVLAAYTNHVGALASTDLQPAPRRWAGALLTTSLLVVAGTLVVMDAADHIFSDGTWSGDGVVALSVGLAIAVATNVSSLALAELVGIGRADIYYVSLACQPLAIFTGAFIVHGAHGHLPAYTAVAVGSTLAPPTVAALWLRVRSLSGPGRRKAGTVAQRSIASTAGPLALRQVGEFLAVGLTPTIAGIAVGPLAAAAYLVPYRLYLAVWSLVGVAHATGWASMVRAYQDGPEAAWRMSKRVSAVSASAGLPLGLLIAGVGPLVGSLIGESDDIKRHSVYVLIGLALALRSIYLGASLAVTAGPPRFRVTSVEVVLAAVAMSIPFWPGLRGHLLAAGIAMCCAATAHCALLTLAVWAPARRAKAAI